MSIRDKMIEDNIENNPLFGLEDEDTQKDRYLTFKIATENYAIEIKYILEIISIQRITTIPEVPDFIKGVINLRGKVIPVIDIRTRFKLDFREYDERTCIIVIKVHEVVIGLIVDTINEVILMPEENIENPTSLGVNNKNKFIMGLGHYNESVVIILDVDKLLHENEIELLSNESHSTGKI